MAVEGPVRRIIIVLLVLLPVGIAASLWREDSLGTTTSYALLGVGVCGFLIGCYLFAGRSRD